MAIDGLVPITVSVLAVSAVVAFVILAVSIVTYLYNAHSLFEHLRMHYPRAWEALGKPHLFKNNSIRNGGTFAAVLDSNVSEEISDQDVAHMLRKTKWLHSVSTISFTLCLGCILAYSVFANLNGRL